MQEDAFLQLLVEVIGIEFTILLRDALAPFHAASASAEPSASSVPEDMDLTGSSQPTAGEARHRIPTNLSVQGHHVRQ